MLAFIFSSKLEANNRIVKMMRDLETRTDIELLVNSFYQKVKSDDKIGFFFNDVAKIDWNKHLPTMYDFWEMTLFHKGNYKGNTVRVHQDLNERSPLKKEHFEHWVKLFHSTLDELFEGTNTDLAKTRALSIATVMQIKIPSS